MSTVYAPFGQALPNLAPHHLQHAEARRLLEACLHHRAFDVIELRSLAGNDSSESADLIIVDCSDGTVPSRSLSGIKNRERLALLYHPGATPHEVRALREGFPPTLHQNHVPLGEPPSLCLYFEPWSAVERDWTPQRHLERILWWLRETARGTLHRSDQPLEQLYFTPPYELVLPPNFAEQITVAGQVLSFWAVPCPSGAPRMIRAVFTQETSARKHDLPFGDFLMVSPQPLSHGPVERYPWTLGELHDQFEERGSGILDEIRTALQARVTDTGIGRQAEANTLLLVNATVRRAPSEPPERSDPQIFFIHADLATLGVASGTLFDGLDGKAYVVRFGDTAARESWRDLGIEPIGVAMCVTPKTARIASGVPSETELFHGVLAGVGALGSLLADLWAREGWGQWTFVDDDYVRPHNVVRHIARDEHVGCSKAEVVRDMTNATYFPGQLANAAFHAKLLEGSNEAIAEAIAAADLIVDATTTLEVPRDLSVLATYPRAASVFLTPSARGSVLLLEDRKQSVRLHALEAQYYRALLTDTWGADHLRGHAGELWVGAGCRDISAVISQELLQLHGATLARQLRALVEEDQAQMRVWELHDATGALAAHKLPVSKVIVEQQGEWRVVWDEYLREKLFEMRSRGLPNETGGILLGYFDHKLKILHLVDALSAPPDSDAAPDGFTRGQQGLKEAREEWLRRTAHIVDYVGDWHSHPRGATARPSILDVGLVAHLALIMAQDGLPVLMIIVSENEVKMTLGEVVAS